MIQVTFRTRPTRTLTFDLENRPLAYWYDGQTTSEITAFGWKWSDEPRVWTMLLRPDGRWDISNRSEVAETISDGHAYRLFVGQLAESDLAVGHNILRHDLPMLNAALIRRQQPKLAPVRVTDTYKHLPKRGGLSVSLENLVALLGVKGRKYAMNQPSWELANRLTDEGVQLARKRVASDVVLQARLHKKLLELGWLSAPKVWAP